MVAWAAVADLTIELDHPPAEALYLPMRALRRVGARITRYDAEEGTLEAWAVRWRAVGVVRVRTEEVGAGVSRVRATSEPAEGPRVLARVAGAWALRRLRVELGRGR